MMNILIVEDDTTQIMGLKNIISEVINDCHIDMAQTYDNAMEYINANKDYDIFLLDISLCEDPDAPTGLDLGKYIRTLKVYNSTPIIFITSLNDKIQYAVNSIHCYSYLVKPYTHNEVENALTDILDSSIIKEKPILFKSPDGVRFKVYPSKIFYITPQDHGISITYNSGNFITRQFTLETIINELPGNFYRCHRKYIVNMNYISNYDKVTSMIHIQNASIPIGRAHKQNFERRYLLNE